jgi:hypothetical protein
VVDVLAVAGGQRLGDGEPVCALPVRLPGCAQEQRLLRPLVVEAVGEVELMG